MAAATPFGRPTGAVHGLFVLTLLLDEAAAAVAASPSSAAGDCGKHGGCDGLEDVSSMLHVRARGAKASLPSQPTARGTRRAFMWMSDAHVDPLYGQSPPGGLGGQMCKQGVNVTRQNEYGIVGCDPPLSLLTSAAKAAANNTAGVEFIVYTGDFSRHDADNFEVPWRGVTNNIHEVAEIIQSEMSPKIAGYAGGEQAFGAIGNDDSPSDYYINITTQKRHNAWISDVGVALFHAGVLSEDKVSNYSYGGFFEEVVGGLTVVNLNTVIYSVSHQPEVVPPPEDPFRQFVWLRSRLKSAVDENRTVWIVGHIPPGIETYGYSELWKPLYVERYLEIVQDSLLGPAVAAQLFGHLHKEEFRLLPDPPAGTGPIFIMGAITPVYDNNPGFRFLEYDLATQRPVSYREFWAEMPSGKQSPRWRFGYDLLSAYEVLKNGVEESGALYQVPFEALANRMLDGMKDWDTYASWYTTQYSNKLNQCGIGEGNGMNQTQKFACRKQYRCAITVKTQKQFNECVNASAWIQMAQKAAAPLRYHEHSYFPVLRKLWDAEMKGVPEEAAWLIEAISEGMWETIAAWASRYRLGFEV